MIYVQMDVAVKQEITADVAADAALAEMADVRLSSGLFYCYAYVAAMTADVAVAIVVAVAAVVDSVAETLAYGLLSYYSAVAVMVSARIIDL